MNQLQVDQLLPQQLLHSRVFSVVITDLSGGYLYVNPLFQEKFSFVTNQLLGTHFSNTVYAHDVSLCNAAAKACIKSPGKSVGITVRKATDETDYNWTQWELSCVRNESGTAMAIICVGHDVTKKEPYNSSLDDHQRVHATPSIGNKMNDEQFISLVNNIPGVIYRCLGDEDFSVVFISNEIENLTGFPAAHFMNNKKDGYSALIYPDDKPLVKQTILEAIHKKQQYAIEYRVIHKDCLLYTSPSPRDGLLSRMPSSA